MAAEEGVPVHPPSPHMELQAYLHLHLHLHLHLNSNPNLNLPLQVPAIDAPSCYQSLLLAAKPHDTGGLSPSKGAYW